MKLSLLLLIFTFAFSQTALAKKKSGKKKSNTAAAAPFSREGLLKKSKIPLERKFPLSPRSTPCQDFHHYVCAEAEYKFKLPASRDLWVFSFVDNHERLMFAKKSFFQKMGAYKPPTDREAQFKSFYQGCMNESAAAEEEKAFVKEEKTRMGKIKTGEEFADFTQSRIGQVLPTLVSFNLNADRENPLKYNLSLIPGFKSLPERTYYDNTELMAEFKNVLMSFFRTLGLDRVEQRADWVIDYETKYARQVPLDKEISLRVSQNRYITRAEYMMKYPNIKAERFFKTIPESVLTTDLIPEANEFFNKAIIEMPVDQLKSVHLWQAVAGWMDDGYPDFQKKYRKFRSTYLGEPRERDPRDERCTRLTSNFFGMEIDNALIDILFPDFPQDKVISLAENVRKSIISGLQSNKWLSKSTRKAAILKMQTAKLMLVKPQTEEDWDFKPIRKYDSKKKYANMLLAREAFLEKLFKELAEDRKLSRWGMSPLTVNAYYSASDNKFVLPMGILQYPFYDPKAPESTNLGGIGSIIGHELGHAIDDKGAQYDSTGKVVKWFSDSDLEKFKERGQAFVKQFNKIGHDGELTLSENISDHVGLNAAYNAAFPRPDEASTEDKKQFFFTYARLWCTVSNPATQQRMLKTDEHAWGIERINQQVIHVDGFYDAFKCEETDKMYVAPKDRIRVW